MTTNAAASTNHAHLDMRVDFAKRSLADLAADAKTDVRKRIDDIRRALDDAERRLDAGEMPNACGILQGRAFELEMALSRMVTMRDARPAVEVLANAVATLSAEAGR